MRLIIRVTLLFICSTSFAQTNLLDTSSWTAGTGSVTGFSHYDTDVVNVREMGVGPHGDSVMLWKRAAGISSSSGGGFNTDYISIDHTKTYRYTVWIKKTNSDDGRTVVGIQTKNISGDFIGAYKLHDYDSSYPYFWIGDTPSLDTWYLVVGYVHGSSYTGTTNLGGIYLSTDGSKNNSIDDFKFKTESVTINCRNYLYDATNINDSQFFYDPRLYEVNGQEPTLQDLIDVASDTQVPTAPILSSTSQTDTTVDLSWTAATDNVAVTAYKVYKDGVLETTLGNVLTYQVTGLTASTAYDFTVTALDAEGNESITSNILEITTNTVSGGGSGNWILNNQDIYYNAGNVGIGTSTPDEKLAVNGSIHTKEVRVDLDGWSDFVFEKKYKLPTLKEVEQHIKEKGHLKDIPSAKNIEEHGVLLGDMNAKLLQKIEELTLYAIQQKKEIQKLKRQNSRIVKQEKEIEELKLLVEKLIESKK